MDHDRLFKELLTTFFREFVELFLPDLATAIDWDYIEFIDKEIFTDVGSGERHEVDLLVKTRLRGRGDVFFLIHLENESSSRAGFAHQAGPGPLDTDFSVHEFVPEADESGAGCV